MNALDEARLRIRDLTRALDESPAVQADASTADALESAAQVVRAAYATGQSNP